MKDFFRMQIFKYDAAGKRRLTVLGILLAVVGGYAALGVVRFTLSSAMLAYELYEVGQILDNSLQEPETPPKLLLNTTSPKKATRRSLFL